MDERVPIPHGLRSEWTLGDSSDRTSWRHDRRVGFYHNVRAGVKEQAPDSSALKTFLARAREAAGDGEGILGSKESVDFLALEIGKKKKNTRFHVEAGRGGRYQPDACADWSEIVDGHRFEEMDETGFGLTMGVFGIMGSGSVRHLGETVAALAG